MEFKCFVCGLNQQKFQCMNCIKKHIENSRVKTSVVEQRIQELTEQLKKYQKEEIQPDFFLLISRLDYLDKQIHQKQIINQDLKTNLEALKLKVKISKELINGLKLKQKTNLPNQSISTLPDQTITNSKLVKYRKILIQDLIRIFRLRKVQRKYRNHLGEHTSVEYRLINVGLPSISKIPTLPSNQIEKLNACIGYALQMTILLAYYLDVYLPFKLKFHGNASNVCISEADDGLKPLFLTDSNSENFLIGLSALNFDIAYLCNTQKCRIPLEKTHETLEMLAILCQSADLGNIEKPEPFQLEIEDVLDHHQHMSMSSKPWEMVDFNNNNTITNHEPESDNQESWDILDHDEYDC